MKRAILAGLLVWACFLTVSRAQLKRPETAKLLPSAAPATAAPGETLEVPVRLEVMPAFHINAEKPTFDYLVPTKLEWISKEFKVLGVEYPAAERYTFEFSPGKPIDVYQGTVTIRNRFQVPRATQPGKVTLRGRLRYQACDNKTCYPPVTLNIDAPVEIVKSRKK